mmetsp:Transcript_20891/g.45202  ORF Transcript_20891/g.45202 Transcript_20891/m.45202 type:complete len:103 (+) Transcript_20891:39-347(+)
MRRGREGRRSDEVKRGLQLKQHGGTERGPKPGMGEIFKDALESGTRTEKLGGKEGGRTSERGIYSGALLSRLHRATQSPRPECCSTSKTGLFVSQTFAAPRA